MITYPLLWLKIASVIDLHTENITALYHTYSQGGLLFCYDLISTLCIGTLSRWLWQSQKRTVKAWQFWLVMALIFTAPLIPYAPLAPFWMKDLHVWLLAIGLAGLFVLWCAPLFETWGAVQERSGISTGVFLCYGAGLVVMAADGHVSGLSELVFSLSLVEWLGYCTLVQKEKPEAAFFKVFKI